MTDVDVEQARTEIDIPFAVNVPHVDSFRVVDDDMLISLHRP